MSPNDIGTCTKCAEPTTLSNPCCNAGVWFEGDIIMLDDLEEETHE
jgi:hypothetical protein